MNAYKLAARVYRSKARHECDLGKRLGKEAKIRYSSGDRMQAALLSTKSKEHYARAEKYNSDARRSMIKSSSQSLGPHTIDLHGLYVLEALEYLETCIKSSIESRAEQLTVITGAGKATNGISRIRAAVEKYLFTHTLDYRIEPTNLGVVLVSLRNSKGFFATQRSLNLIEWLKRSSQKQGWND